jgi:hypothetical protein
MAELVCMQFFIKHVYDGNTDKVDEVDNDETRENYECPENYEPDENDE